MKIFKTTLTVLVIVTLFVLSYIRTNKKIIRTGKVTINKKFLKSDIKSLEFKNELDSISLLFSNKTR